MGSGRVLDARGPKILSLTKKYYENITKNITKILVITKKRLF